MTDAKKPETTNIVSIVRKHAVHGKSAQARRLLRNVGALPRKFKVVKPKPDAVK